VKNQKTGRPEDQKTGDPKNSPQMQTAELRKGQETKRKLKFQDQNRGKPERRQQIMATHHQENKSKETAQKFNAMKIK